MKTKWTVESLIKFEEHIAGLFEEGRINAPVHLCGGNESDLLSLFASIQPHDYIVSTHRNHYHYLLKGGDPDRLRDEILGRTTGICKGMGRSMHIFDPKLRFYTSAIVGGGCAIAVGIALSLKKYKHSKTPKKARNEHVWCFIGDGAEDSGHYVEAVRFGASRSLPLTFVMEDNDMAVDSTTYDRWHNYQPITGSNILRYKYKRRYPHVGIGKHVSM